MRFVPVKSCNYHDVKSASNHIPFKILNALVHQSLGKSEMDICNQLGIPNNSCLSPSHWLQHWNSNTSMYAKPQVRNEGEKLCVWQWGRVSEPETAGPSLGGTLRAVGSFDTGLYVFM